MGRSIWPSAISPTSSTHFFWLEHAERNWALWVRGLLNPSKQAHLGDGHGNLKIGPLLKFSSLDEKFPLPP